MINSKYITLYLNIINNLILLAIFISKYLNQIIQSKEKKRQI